MRIICFVLLIILLNALKAEVSTPNGTGNTPSVIGAYFIMNPIFLSKGAKFNKLTVVERISEKRRTYYLCKCDCGKMTVVESGKLKSGHSKSCGCLKYVGKHNQNRRGKRTPEYSCWYQLKSRCLNINNISYHNYGGRGITVCDRWLESFENFYADMGKKPSKEYSLDRENNEGNYEPSNCRWATKSQQVNNTRRNRFITIDDTTHTLTEWAKIKGIRKGTISTRLRLGYSEYDSIMKPLDLIKSKNKKSKKL